MTPSGVSRESVVVADAEIALKRYDEACARYGAESNEARQARWYLHLVEMADERAVQPDADSSAVL